MKNESAEIGRDIQVVKQRINEGDPNMNWEEWDQGADLASVEGLEHYITELRGARMHVTHAIEHLHDEDAEIDIAIQRAYQRMKKLKEVQHESQRES